MRSWPHEKRLLDDGRLANGAFALRDCYQSISDARPLAAFHGGTEKLRVFLSAEPDRPFEQTIDVAGAQVTVAGQSNGQAMVIHPGETEFVLIGYRCRITLRDPMFRWPELQKVRVERERYTTPGWEKQGEPLFSTFNQSTQSLSVVLEQPQAVHVTWEH